MDQPFRWEVLPNEHVEEDETVSADELYRDIMTGIAALAAYDRGELASRITEVDEAGNRRVFVDTGPKFRGPIPRASEI